MSWPEPTPLRVAEGAVTRLVYEFREQLSEPEFGKLLEILAHLVAHDLAPAAVWDDWGEWPSRGRQAPTLLQVGSVVLRALVFELREQLVPSDYIHLLRTCAELVARELAEGAAWDEWEARPS